MGREVEELAADTFYGPPHASRPMCRQIAHHHDVAGRQCWDEHLFDIIPEHRAVHCAVKHHGSCHA